MKLLQRRSHFETILSAEEFIGIVADVTGEPPNAQVRGNLVYVTSRPKC